MKRCMGCMELLAEGEQSCPHCGYQEGTGPLEGFQLSPGTIISDRYVTGRVLGCGGFGITYIGYDWALERKVAVKEFLPTMFATRMPGERSVTMYSSEHTRQFQEGLQGFVKEAGRVAAFHTVPGVVDVYDTIEENGTAYMIMEYLEGQDMKHVLRENGPMPADTVRDVAIEICRILEPVHQSGMIHRDISPDNIYLTVEGGLKLIDFGAARYETSRNSKSLSVILKSGYAPEEQYRSHGVQGAFTDVYALAATCYKMLTGLTPEDSMERAIEDRLVPPSRVVDGVPEAFENALLNALAVRAEDRTPTVAKFREELEGNQTKRVEVRTRRKDGAGLSGKTKAALAAGFAVTGILALLASTGMLGGGKNLLADSFGSGLKEGYVNAPGIVNLSQEEARLSVEKSGLSYLVTGKEYSEKIEKDRVLTQTPLPGRAVEKGSIVEAVICGGVLSEEEKTGEIPDVVYETYQEGRKAVEEAGANVILEFRYDEYVKTGLITAQEMTGDQEVTLTVSLGSTQLGEYDEFHTIPMTRLYQDGSIPLIEFAAPLKDREGLGVAFEYDLGYDNWKGIKGFENTYKMDYFSGSPQQEPQPLFQSDLLMSLALHQELGGVQTLKVRGTVYSPEEPYPYVPGKEEIQVILDRTASLYPDVKVEKVVEADWSEAEDLLSAEVYEEEELENGTPYLVQGDFKKGTEYYLIDGSGTFGRNRSIPCLTEGQLVVISQKPLDTGTILGSVIPIYDMSIESETSVTMKMGGVTRIDSKYYELSSGMEELRGRSVMDAVEQLGKKNSRYRYRIPYRFRFECNDEIPRGYVIDYILEEERAGGEIYRADFVVSNGKKNDTFMDLIIPVQWLPSEQGESGTYARLVYFTIPPDSLPQDVRYTYHFMETDREDVFYFGGEDGQGYADAMLRGDGTPTSEFYPPEAYFYVDEWAQKMAQQGGFTMGDPVYISMTPAIPNSDVMTGEGVRLEVPLVKDLP